MSAAEVETLIDRALEFVETSGERGEVVSVGDDFQTRPMRGQETLWDMFAANSEAPLDRGLSQELAAWLLKAPRYADAQNWPNGFVSGAISIGSAAPVANDDVEWAHCSVVSSIPVAVLTLHEPRIVPTATAIGNADVHFVADEASRTAFWRKALVVAGDRQQNLVEFGSLAYPNLHFVPGVLADASGLGGGYLGSRTQVKSALEI